MGALVLGDENARTLLANYGFVPAGTTIRVSELGGGVSSRVLLAEADGGRFVLKQPLATFRVADEWHVDDRRAYVEFAFCRALERILPAGSLARVRTFVPESRILVFDAAPPSYASWKVRLLSGPATRALGAEAGRLLAAIHSAGERPELEGRFRHADLFDEQRLEPYFRTSARREPEVASHLSQLAALFGRRQDLVHGDFSPKNLLSDGTRLVLVDHEVVTRGDAAFDVAFLLAHLCLKALHRPQDAASYLDAADAFLHAYAKARPADEELDGRAMAYLGGLLVARVAGKSPVEYLDEARRMEALGVGKRILQDGAPDWAAVRGYLGTTE